MTDNKLDDLNYKALNVVNEIPASVFQVFPTDTDDPIKLLGWLRTYADFPVSSERPHSTSGRDFNQREITYTDILQEIYEAQGTGEWLAVEYCRDRNAAAYPDHTCRVLLTKDKRDISYFFRPSQYSRKLLAAIGINYVIQVGKGV